MSFLILFFLHAQAQAADFDIYRATSIKGSFCAVSGGACAGDSDFDSGFFQNPSSLVVGGENFDFDFDFDMSSEPNSDIGGGSAGRIRSAFGSFGVSTKSFAIAASYIDISRAGSFHQSEINVPMSLRLNREWIVGLGLDVMHLSGIFPLWSADVKLGTIYQPNSHWNFGTWLKPPVNARAGIDSYHLPLQWQTGAEWNPAGSKIHYLAQLDVLGTTEGGVLNQFDGRPGPDRGHYVALQPHFGLRTPFAGETHWNLYAGTYYEASRSQGLEGREHLTGGISYKEPLGLSWWDVAEFMAGVDVAKDFSQLILTFR